MINKIKFIYKIFKNLFIYKHKSFTVMTWDRKDTSLMIETYLIETYDDLPHIINKMHYDINKKNILQNSFSVN